MRLRARLASSSTSTGAAAVGTRDGVVNLGEPRIAAGFVARALRQEADAAGQHQYGDQRRRDAAPRVTAAASAPRKAARPAGATVERPVGRGEPVALSRGDRLEVSFQQLRASGCQCSCLHLRGELHPPLLQQQRDLPQPPAHSLPGVLFGALQALGDLGVPEPVDHAQAHRLALVGG